MLGQYTVFPISWLTSNFNQPMQLFLGQATSWTQYHWHWKRILTKDSKSQGSRNFPVHANGRVLLTFKISFFSKSHNLILLPAESKTFPWELACIDLTACLSPFHLLRKVKTSMSNSNILINQIWFNLPSHNRVSNTTFYRHSYFYICDDICHTVRHVYQDLVLSLHSVEWSNMSTVENNENEQSTARMIQYCIHSVCQTTINIQLTTLLLSFPSSTQQCAYHLNMNTWGHHLQARRFHSPFLRVHLPVSTQQILNYYQLCFPQEHAACIIASNINVFMLAGGARQWHGVLAFGKPYVTYKFLLHISSCHIINKHITRCGTQSYLPGTCSSRLPCCLSLFLLWVSLQNNVVFRSVWNTCVWLTLWNVIFKTMFCNWVSGSGPYLNFQRMEKLWSDAFCAENTGQYRCTNNLYFMCMSEKKCPFLS